MINNLAKTDGSKDRKRRGNATRELEETHENTKLEYKIRIQNQNTKLEYTKRIENENRE